MDMANRIPTDCWLSLFKTSLTMLHIPLSFILFFITEEKPKFKWVELSTKHFFTAEQPNLMLRCNTTCSKISWGAGEVTRHPECH